MNELSPIGPGAWAFIGVYLMSLLLIGFIARRARRENTLRDFYLAGRGFGFTVLFLTLFATQYSGNTFFAFTGNTYRIGYPWIMSLHFMTAIVICYLIFAPRLHALAKTRGYVTPADFIHDRFAHRLLTLLVTLVMIVGLSNFLLAQLMAMGRAMQGLSRSNPDHAYTYGVILLALIMVLYGTLGGIRAVAWTDAIQGVILAVGFGILLFILFERYGSLTDATRLIQQRDADFGLHRATAPNAARCREWLSYVLTVGFAMALYPQAIQRIYAARSSRVLKQSLAAMVFMPLPTMIIAMIAGIMALAYIPGLEGAAADQAFGRVLRDIQQHSMVGYGLVILMLSAILAAMMSTADSALLSISSMITKDFYAALIRPKATEAHLTMIGKTCSWLLIALLVVLAIGLRERSSLIALLDRKLDILMQLVPAFFVGLRFHGLRATPTFVGAVVGLAVALSLAFGDFDFVHKGKVGGFHPGLVALVPNLAIALCGSLTGRPKCHWKTTVHSEDR
jgi:Na+/proline symporter